MQKSMASAKANIEKPIPKESPTNLECHNCGENFHTPLLARIYAHDSCETYEACPRCLAEIRETKQQKRDKSEYALILGDTETAVTETEQNMNCQYSFGYLGKRPKSTPIPEECLTCEKMIDCMVS